MVEEYDKDVPNNYNIKHSFVRYHRPSRDDWMNSIEYVADLEDEVWLSNNTKFGAAVNRPPQQPGHATTDITDGVPNADGEIGGAITAAAIAQNTEILIAASQIPEASTAQIPKRPQLPLEMFEHIMDVLEKATAFDAIVSSGQAEHLTYEKVPQICQIFPIKGNKATVVTTKHVINDIYNYWVQKRSKLKRPLLRRYWPVTSTDDTNPHLVFRPREKEKYKLRKTRRNDLLSYNKMKQLRSDFENVRLLLDLIRKREQLHRVQVRMQCEVFEQKLFDLTDTSGKPRISKYIKKRDIEEALAVPTYFDMQTGARGKIAKRGRKAGGAGSRNVSPVPSSFGRGDAETESASVAVGGGAAARPGEEPRIVAGHNFGEPAPGFLHPLNTRETYISSWENSVPHVTSYIDAHALPTFRFRHRPRVGRGGRVVIDRLPCPPHPDSTPITFFTAGKGLARYIPGQSPEQAHLLDLLPPPLDHKSLSRRIEELSIAALQEDIELSTSGPQTGAGVANAAGGEGEEADVDQVLVKLDDWLETDGQPWGEERFAIGPL